MEEAMDADEDPDSDEVTDYSRGLCLFRMGINHITTLTPQRVEKGVTVADIVKRVKMGAIKCVWWASNVDTFKSINPQGDHVLGRVISLSAGDLDATVHLGVYHDESSLKTFERKFIDYLGHAKDMINHVKQAISNVDKEVTQLRNQADKDEKLRWHGVFDQTAAHTRVQWLESKTEHACQNVQQYPEHGSSKFLIFGRPESNCLL